LPQSIKKYFEDRTGNIRRNEMKKLDQVVAEAERQAITNALKITGYNKAKAAEILGIPRSTLYYKIQSLRIECPTN